VLAGRRGLKGAFVMVRFVKVLATVAAFTLTAGLLLADDAAGKGKKGKKGRHSAEAIFKKMDANGDGKVSKEEFVKFHEEVRKKIEDRLAAKGKKPKGKGSAKAVDRRFKMLDENNDGFITLDEFKSGMAKAKAKRDELRAKKKAKQTTP
jgi:hypothetical protein